MTNLKNLLTQVKEALELLESFNDIIDFLTEVEIANVEQLQAVFERNEELEDQLEDYDDYKAFYVEYHDTLDDYSIDSAYELKDTLDQCDSFRRALEDIQSITEDTL